jgi:hypothetical protein
LSERRGCATIRATGISSHKEIAMRLKFVGLAVTMLGLAALACALPTSNSGGPLFKDDFSRSNSGWESDTGSSQGTRDYENGEYVFKIKEGGWIFWAVPKNKFSIVHIEVSATNPGDATDAGFGLLCNYKDDDHFYLLGIGSDGLYSIQKKDGASNYQILSSQDGYWSKSDQITVNAAQYRIGADCGNGKLTLYADGNEIASVDDATFSEGDAGLFAQSAKQANVEVHFDNFIVTSLSK